MWWVRDVEVWKQKLQNNVCEAHETKGQYWKNEN